MGRDPNGFEFIVRGGDVVIRHHGIIATTLRGATAVKFLDAVDAGDPQQLMARATGNYKRGNEGTSRAHPRNTP